LDGDNSELSGPSTCLGGVDGDSAPAAFSWLITSSGDLKGSSCVTAEARRSDPDEADEDVASRIYSTTSHVCNVASGAKDTRLFAKDLRRASFRFLMSASVVSFAPLRMDLTEGNADYISDQFRSNDIER
jgi:hypothetical protein